MYLTSTDELSPHWFKISFLGQAETVIKSGFGDRGLNISDSILGRFTCFE